MAKQIELSMNEGYPLLEQGAAYIIEKGSVNLYAIKKRRFFLGHFKAGEALFALPSTDTLTFSLYAEEPSLLRKAQTNEISAHQIEEWVKKINETVGYSLQGPEEELATIHSEYIHILEHQLVASEKDALGRIEKKKAEKEQLLTDLELKMSSLLTTAHPSPPPQLNELLFQAFYLVAKAMGLDPQQPKEEIPSDEVSDHLEIYCKINRMRKRQVRLTRGIFQESSTHFLAFSKESGEPIALIKKRPGRYVAVDLKREERKNVDSIEPFSPIAYVFYETLPKALYKGSSIIKDYLSKRKKEFLPLLTYGVLGSLLSLALPFATYLFFKEAIPKADLSQITQIVVGLVLAGTCASSFFFFQSLIIARIEGMAGNEIELGIWDRLIKLPVHFFQKFSSGDLSYRVMSVEKIRQVFTNEAARALLSGIFSIGYLIVMAIFSAQLALVAFCITAVASLFVWISCRNLVRLERAILAYSSRLNGFLVQIIRGIAKLRLAKAETYAFSVWGTLFIKNKRLQIKAQNHRNTILTLNSIYPFVTYGALFGYVFLLQKQGAISIAEFLAFNTAFLAFTYAFFDVTRTLMQVTSIKPLWERTEPILSSKEEISEKKLYVEKLSGDLHLDGISFRYEENSPVILQDLSLSAKPGESIAIVGPSGSGKSTIVRLLLGFEKPESGAIYYGNQDLDHLDLHDVRRNLGVVMQSEGMIAGTLFENLVRGSFYSKEAIERAIKLSCFDQELAAFPMGLHTYIPMNGETLSGGQKQRLLLARALLPEPKILIFDEATSALDSHTQEIVSKNIDALNITRVIIAHRLSTIKSVDKVYVLDKGKLVQEGSYEMLSQQPGLFSSMLERQKLL
jgi:ATP-binding cassette subfamily C protein